MFSIFKRKNKELGSSAEVVPVTQQIELVNDIIMLVENDQFKGTVKLDIVDKIVFEHYGMYDHGRPNCWLTFFSKGKEMLSISTLANNYEKLDEKLVAISGFNATNYRELINYDKPMSDVVIFRREIKEDNEPVVGNDITFVDDSAFEKKDNQEIPAVSETVNKFKDLESKFGGFDFDFGSPFDDKINAAPAKPKDVTIDDFIIIDDRETLVTWKSFDSIDRKYFTRDLFEEGGKLGYVYKIEFITIFDSVKLPYLETRSVLAKNDFDINEKYPVQEYTCEIHSNYMLDEFNKLTEKINTFFGKKGETYSTEERLPVYNLVVNTVTIDIKTTPTSIKIKFIKEIDESAFYTKTYATELNLNYINTLRIPSKINILGTYKNSRRVMYTPNCLAGLFESENDTVFWIHKDGSKIGMANQKFAVTFSPIKIIKIRLAVAVDKDLEETGNTIEIIYKDGKKYSKLSVENSKEFANYLPQVMQFIKVPFTLYKHDS